MNKKHFYAAVILLLFLAAGIQPALALISVPTQTHIGDLQIATWDETDRIYTLITDVPEGLVITEDSLTLIGAGVNGKTITGSGSGTGISLEDRRYVTVKNLIVEGFVVGISLDNYWQSDYIDLYKRDGYNTIENNTISSNDRGINVGSSNWNTVNYNTVSTCDYGIHLAGSRNNTVTYNTVNSSSEYGIYLNQGMQGSVWIGSDENTLTSNNVTGVSITGGIGIYIHLCIDNTLSINTVSNYEDGIRLSHSYSNIDQGNTLTTNNISNNYWGIHLYLSNNNSLTGNNVTDNAGGIWLDTGSNENNLINNTVLRNGPGIYLRISSNSNTLTGNTASNNDTGILLLDSSNNTIYHNNFTDNTTQASVSGGTGNDFDFNGSGNYWSNWTGPDEVEPFGIVDDPYVFTGGQDNFPLAEWPPPTPPTPEQALLTLIDTVEELNTKEGIINSLDAKLQNALDALDAANAGQRQDAINKIEAFINAVEAQSGNQITEADADELIDYANYIIELI